MPLSFHANAARALEEDSLPRLLALLVAQLVLVVRSRQAVRQGEASQIVADLVSCLEQVLSWEFVLGSGEEKKGLDEKRHITRAESLGVRLVRPGRAWHEPLVQAALPELLLAAYNLYRNVDPQVAHSLRTCLDQLICLHGAVFTDAASKQRFQTRLAKGVANMLSRPPSQATQGELRGACNLWHSLTASFQLQGLFALPNPRALLQLVAKLTAALLADTTLPAETRQESLELCMGSWHELCSQYERLWSHEEGGGKGAVPGPWRLAMEEVGLGLFRTWLQTRLAQAGQGPHPDMLANPDAGRAQERAERELEAAALLGRVAHGPALAWLSELLAGRCKDWKQAMDSRAGAREEHRLQRELYWLVRVAGRLALGQWGNLHAVLVPEILLHLPASASSSFPSSSSPATAANSLSPPSSAGTANLEPLLQLVNTVFSVVMLETQTLVRPERRGEVLRELSGASLWFLQRWSSGVLNQAGCSRYRLHAPRLAQLYSTASRASLQAVDFFLSKLRINLLAARGPPMSPELAKHTLQAFSKALDCTKTHELCTQTKAWPQLLKCFLEDQLVALPPDTQGELVCLLCAVACDAQDSRSPEVQQQGAATLQHVLQGVASRWQHLQARTDIAQVAQQPALARHVAAVLQLLIGVTSAKGQRASQHAMPLLKPMLEPLAQLLPSLWQQAELAHQTVRFFAQFAKGNLCYLNEADTRACLAVLNGLVNKWVVLDRRRAGQQQQLDAAQAKLLEEQRAADLALLMDILAEVLSKQAFNKASPPFDASFCSHMVLVGLAALLPCLGPDMLVYKEVLEGYFALLELVVTYHPEHLARLSDSAKQQMAQSAQGVLKHHDAEVAVAGAQIIRHIADFEAKYKSVPAIQSPFQTFVQPFFRSVLETVVSTQLCSAELVDALADALLSLVVCDTAGYHVAFKSLLQPRLNTPAYGELVAGFTELVQRNGITRTTDRDNQDRFRANLRNFLSTTRILFTVK
eukprot:g32560.t1